VLFKRFADIDSIDIEVDTEDCDEFINAVKYLGPTFGGINLEDIKAPECFIIEEKLKSLLNIPVFHDDQHGTAIITLAGLINACKITKRNFEDLKIVVNGAGAAAIACIELIKSMGAKSQNIILCDTRGIIYEGRKEGMNPWKAKHAVKTDKRSLAEAIEGADVFLGLSVKGAVSKEMIRSMANKPIIFAMANPDPEILPEHIKEVRSDAIIATGRSDYPNQVNNVMGFPYIFRGALDVRATEINEEMKIAAALALAELANEPVPEEVSRAYSGKKMQFGPDYIIPVPFDPRLISTVPVAVANAAIESGVAKFKLKDIENYRQQLLERLDPAASNMNLIFNQVSKHQKTIIFAEGEEPEIIIAAMEWINQGYGKAILIGRERRIKERAAELNLCLNDKIVISNARIDDDKLDDYIDFMYDKLQRKGFLHRDCARMVKNDRNIFAACMLAKGHGDAIISGFTRGYTHTLDAITKLIDNKPNQIIAGVSIVINNGKALFISDTAVNELPSANELADITEQTAEFAKLFGQTPRVALLSFSNFGSPHNFAKAERIRETVSILEHRKPSFEFDGEMAANVALNAELMKLYPFCKLTAPANVLIMPALHSANISAGILQELGNSTVIGPILLGLSKPVQLVNNGDSTTEIINRCAFAALQSISND
jgi:malate dehydrogenase (oxaloacetate-decarboxylating)(NADP+)